MTSTDPSAGASSTWQLTARLTLSGDRASLSAVSRASATFCVAVDTGGDVLTSTNPAGGVSAWTVTSVDGAVALSRVSCPSASFCVALDGLGVSGPTASFCVLADGSGNVVIAAAPAPSKTTITSVTRAPVVGQKITIGVRVANATGGQGDATPAGAVTISDGTRQCSAALCGSAGSCVLVEGAPGIYSLSARYVSQAPVAGSATVRSTRIKVGRATSKTTLDLSATKIRYGHEQSERLTVSARAEFTETPAGAAAGGPGLRCLARLRVPGLQQRGDGL